MMDNNDFAPTVKVLIVQVTLGLIGSIANIPWIGIITCLGISVSGGYTLYKWYWSHKFNKANWKIKEAELDSLLAKARKHHDDIIDKSGKKHSL